MRAHTKLEIQHAVVVKSDDVSKIWKSISIPGTKTKAVATCTDGIVRHFDSCEELLGYENPLRASFVSLEISAMSTPHERAEVSIGQKYSSVVALSLHGQESNISDLRRSLADVVDGMKPWYSWVATVSLLNLLFPFVFVCLTLFVLTSTFKIENSPGMPPSRAMLTIVIAVLAIGVIAGCFWVIQYLRTRYFPKISFSIGQGLGRHQTHENIRWVLVVGFIVNVVASIVVSVMLT